MIIGDKLRKIRELNNYTEKFVAGKIGISVSQYSKIERNDSPLTLNRLSEIAKIYDLGATEILSWDDKNIFHLDTDKTPNSSNHHQKVTSNFPAIEIIEHLKEEIRFLKSENERLWTLIEK